MKIQFLKVRNWLLLSLMGLFGVTACHSSKEAAQQPVSGGNDSDGPAVQPSPRGEVAVMYGVPTMNFIVKGKVTDDQGKPVNGIQVTLINQSIDVTPEYLQLDNPYVKEYFQRVSDTTDAQGLFTSSTSDVPVEAQRILVRDIDGSANGQFEDQMIDVDFSDGQQTRAGKGWDRGEKVKEINIVLNKK